MSTLMYITVPDDVEVDTRVFRCNCGNIINNIVQTLGLVPKETRKVTFGEWMVNNPFSDQQLIDKEAAIDSALWLADMKKSFRALKANDVLPLGKGDYEKVLRAMQKPTGSYSATFVTEFTSFLKAVKNASETDPRTGKTT